MTNPLMVDSVRKHNTLGQTFEGLNNKTNDPIGQSTISYDHAECYSSFDISQQSVIKINRIF